MTLAITLWSPAIILHIEVSLFNNVTGGRNITNLGHVGGGVILLYFTGHSMSVPILKQAASGKKDLCHMQRVRKQKKLFPFNKI